MKSRMLEEKFDFDFHSGELLSDTGFNSDGIHFLSPSVESSEETFRLDLTAGFLKKRRRRGREREREGGREVLIADVGWGLS